VALKQVVQPNQNQSCSSKPDHVDVLDKNGEEDFKASQANWVSAKFFRPFSDGYGYQWWQDKNDAQPALGTSGQYTMIGPEENLVVVVTSSANERAPSSRPSFSINTSCRP
jgi:CubicO group peptidase (beta-lactamase class C family)